jgi:methionyl-tRNA formyltransferase
MIRNFPIKNTSNQIAFLGWNHPAQKSFEKLAKQGWVSVLILPSMENWRAESVLSIARKYDIKVEAKISKLENYNYSIIVCSNYPKIVPEKWLKDKIAINCHWSLLPKYRGMHSTAWALINGDEYIGQSIHFMEGEFDTGDVIVQSSIKVDEYMDITDIFKALSDLEADNLHNVIEEYFKSGIINRDKQNEDHAIYVPRRTERMGRIDWAKSSKEIWNLTRALPVSYYPPAYTYLGENILEIIEAELVDSDPYVCIPGEIVRVQKNYGVNVKTGDSVIKINKVRKFGEREILDATDVLARGMHLGIDLEDEIFSLKKKVIELTNQIELLQ